MRLDFRNLVFAVAALGCTAFLSSANATPTLVGTTTNPTGINGLVVDGTIYDVTFSVTTLNSPFTFNVPPSGDAALALADALNLLGVTSLGGVVGQDGYVLDVDDSISEFDAVETEFGSGWAFVFDVGLSNLGQDNLGDFTQFGQAVDFTKVGTVGVPEPLSLSLFGAGLAGAVAIRRRKKAA